MTAALIDKLDALTHTVWLFAALFGIASAIAVTQYVARKALAQDLARVIHRNAIVTTALSWYADPDNWKAPGGKRHCDAVIERGAFARKILAAGTEPTKARKPGRMKANGEFATSGCEPPDGRPPFRMPTAPPPDPEASPLPPHDGRH